MHLHKVGSTSIPMDVTGTHKHAYAPMGSYTQLVGRYLINEIISQISKALVTDNKLLF